MSPRKFALQHALGAIFVVTIALHGGEFHAWAQSQQERSWEDIKARPGEDIVRLRRNFFLNGSATRAGNRFTVVEFDHTEIKCPAASGLLFSQRNTIKLAMPNWTSESGRPLIYSNGGAFVVWNLACRYVLTVKRYERDSDKAAEMEVRLSPPPPTAPPQPPRKSPLEDDVLDPKYIPRVKTLAEEEAERPLAYRQATNPPAEDQSGFAESVVPFDHPQEALDFSGLVYFSLSRFTVYLVNVGKDLTVASESNALTHTYWVEIRNSKTRVRISIDKEFYSNGEWKNAYAN